MFYHYLLDWGDIAQWVSEIFLILFFVSYTIYAKWWKNSIGWVVNIFVISLILIIGPSLAALTDPALFARFFVTKWYQVLETFNLTFLAVSAITGTLVWRRLHNLRRLPGEKDGRKKEQDTHKEV